MEIPAYAGMSGLGCVSGLYSKAHGLAQSDGFMRSDLWAFSDRTDHHLLLVARGTRANIDQRRAAQSSTLSFVTMGL